MLKCINPTTFFSWTRLTIRSTRLPGQSSVHAPASFGYIGALAYRKYTHVAFVAFPPTMLEHFLVFEDWTQQLGVCDIWAGNREHPSSLLPLCQPRARQLLRSKEDPLMPTITQYVAFLSSYINFMLQAIHHFAEWSQCCYSYNAMQLLFMLDTLNHSWLFWFGFGCNSMPLLEHPSDLWSPTVCVYCDSFFFFFSNMLSPQRCFITYKSVLVGSDSAASEGQVAVIQHTHTHSLYINLNAWRTEQVFVVVVVVFYPFHVFRLINRDIYWAQAQVSDTSAEDSGSPSSQHAPTLEFLDYQFAIFDFLFFCFQGWIDLTQHGESRWNSKSLKQWHDE